MARWAYSRTFIDGPNDLDDEDDEEETEVEAEDEVDEAEDGNEETESGAKIHRAVTDTTNADITNADGDAANKGAADTAATEAATQTSVDGSLKSAADIGAAVVHEVTKMLSETPSSATNPGATDT